VRRAVGIDAAGFLRDAIDLHAGPSMAVQPPQVRRLRRVDVHDANRRHDDVRRQRRQEDPVADDGRHRGQRRETAPDEGGGRHASACVRASVSSTIPARSPSTYA
jgi:hypothetical protein